jgi:uncharacterized lipoprotein YddW (UPF0748 family)
MNHRAASLTNRSTRRQFLTHAAAATGALAFPTLLTSCATSGNTGKPAAKTGRKPVKAFCIDFNWGDHGAAEPRLFAQADPQEHVRWYQDLGANVIQTFCVSYNGYAWYPSEVAPVTPGLKHPNFLGDMVKLGHSAGLKVMGYYTLGANPYWEARNPELVHATTATTSKSPSRSNTSITSAARSRTHSSRSRLTVSWWTGCGPRSTKTGWRASGRCIASCSARNFPRQVRRRRK